MKKLLVKILIGVLAVTTMLACLVGCNNVSWQKPTMTSWGEGNIVGGFIGEKGDYLYYINGVGRNTEDNTFGVPVKGALMVANKTDLTKSEVVVPKLLVASDYKAGLYIYGDYVYYGTPNTDKTSKGEIANTELTFMKTKLDGSETVEFFTLSSLSAEYRIVEKDKVVYIVYYDSVDTALEVYNCNDGTTSTIAKTDAKADGESLNAYKFANNGSEAIVYYTTTIYAEKYNENKTEERAKENYNKVYAYKAGDDVGAQSAILDGSKVTPNPATYEIKMVQLGVMFYSETINAVAKTYAYNIPGEIQKADTVLADTTLFTEKGIYTVTEGKIEQVDLFSTASTRTVAINTGATALLAVNGKYIYFTDSESGISRIELNNQDAKIEKVTEDTAFTTWYPIQFIGDNMFYCDNSTQGASYIKYVDVTGEVTTKDDKCFLESQKSLGLITDEDKVAIATAKVDAIANELDNGVLKFEEKEDGTLFVASVDEAVVAVDGVKGIEEFEVPEDTLNLLAKYEKAVKMANLYNKLEGIRFETTDVDYKKAYDEVKAEIEEFMASEDYSTVSAFIGQNRLWNYQEAKKLFNK